MSPRTRYRIVLAITWVLILAYGLYFSALSIQRHRAFLTHASDLGQIDQAIWNTLQGNILEHTKATGVQNIRLSDHVEPVFVPLSLVFLIYDNVEALLIVQSFAIAIGALAVFWIAHKRFAEAVRQDGASFWDGWPEVAGVVFAALYLLFPALEAANLAEFHAVTLAPAPLLFAYHYGSERRWGRFALFALIALAVKEEISLLVLFMAGWFAVEAFRTQMGRFRIEKAGQAGAAARSRAFRFLNSELRINLVPLALAVLALGWFGLTYFVIIPHFNPLGKSPYTCRYVVSEDCRTAVVGLFPAERLGYLGMLLAPVGFMALLDPIALLLGLPLLAANVLSNYPAQYSGTFHYSAPVAPYLVLAGAGGTARALGWLRARLPNNRRWAGAVLAVPLAAGFAYHLAAGYTPIGGEYAWPAISPHNLAFERLAAQIPRAAIVSTTTSLNPHLSHRRVLYRWPVLKDAEYVLLDVSESANTNPFDFRIAYNDALEQGGFGVVDGVDGYVLLKRGVKEKNLPDVFFSAFRAVKARPQFPVTIDFADKVRFLGYDVNTDQYGRVSLRLYWKRLDQLDRNYFLFPFYADADGQPREDVTLPMTLLLWYPPAMWQQNEIIVGRTVPMDVGARTRVGLAVIDGDRWADLNARLPLRLIEPAGLPLFDDSTWVELGQLVRRGDSYSIMQAK